MLMTRRFLLGHGVKASFLLPALTASAAASAARPARQSPARSVESSARKPAPPLVVLDPGHGGKDPGAIGLSGTYEKQISLATAFELRGLLEASGRYRVVLTRNRDRFIRLEDRVAIAHAASADLFVSMHADALSDHAVRGASVYTLSDTASDAQTAALARRENAADRFAGTYADGVTPEVARILASLVRQETRLGSARMARSVVGSFGGALPVLQNPSRHASFAVLQAADIPSVLVEMGFMSNPLDEADLRHPEHRTRVAQAMRRAIENWFATTGQVTRLS
jgi:N-acetylmuramoyl-L-alanine amidase